MNRFSIHFSYPWLLLLLIPAFALALIPYFRLSKRYRRTRNRIISIVTHLCVMVLCICVLCGIQFRYVKTNKENEILLLVDVSDTEERAKARRDEFVRTVLADGRYDGYKMGVVTFGFTQNYAVPLTYKVDDIYDMYKAAELPDTSATNIEGALKYAKDLFGHPESSKVVLISDGLETDGNAFSAIRALTAQGTVVDTALISEAFIENDVQITGIQLPETHVKPNEDCTVKVLLRSRQVNKDVRVVLKDNGEAVKVTDADGKEQGAKVTDLALGANEVTFTLKFASAGVHEITAEIVAAGDALAENNEYTTYINLQSFNKVLIIEQKSAESEALIKLLNDNEYVVDRLNLASGNELKTANDAELKTVNDLRRYDQVIMNNVSNGDLARFDGFTEMLYSYVNDYGGGLLTLGGDDAEGNAHAYSRNDLRGTQYQELLPVEAINYTPPVGLVVCVDRSGSMSELFEYARAGLRSCYEALTERDYIGIVSLDNEYGTILPLTSRTNANAITRAFANDALKETGGSTNFFSALQRAGEMLQSNKQVEKRHIIIVSDGYCNGENDPPYDEAKSLAQRGISISIVLVGSPSAEVKDNMQKLVEPGQTLKLGGRVTEASGKDLIDEMYNDLRAKQVEETVNEPFAPIVKSPTSSVFSGVEYGINQDAGSGGSGSGSDDDKEKDERDAFRMRVKLGGFYGVKKKDGAETLLTGEYDVTPLYAQWKFGAGTVGSFMCDLTGLVRWDGSPSWSAEFMADANGKKLILNIIDNLMPLEDISPAAYEYQLTERNYTNTLRVYANLENGETLEAKLVCLSGGAEDYSVSLNENSDGADVYVITPFGKSNQYSRCEFIVKKAGVYKILLTKRNADGEEIAHQTVELYKTFAFSEEYNLYPETDDAESFLVRLAANGNGKKIEDVTDPKEVFEGFITGIEKTFDPRYLFAILSIVLLLTDIAVRKFKFKWLHEIIRQKKQQKENRKAA